MKTLSKLSFAALLILASIVFLSCGSEKEAGGLGSIDEPVTIKFWGWPASDKAVESIIEGFNAQYPNITVEVEMKNGPDTTRDALTAAITAGAGAPDVAMIEIKDIDKFVLFGGLQDLKASPFEAGEYEKDFVEYKWKQATSMDGKLLAFPWDIGPASIFYRRDLFEAAGYPSDPESVRDLLSTWDGFVEVGEKVTALGEDIFFTDNASQIPYIYYSHKNLFTQDLELNIDTPKTRQILEVARQVRTLDIDGEFSYWSEEWYQALGSGRIAVSIMGSWFGGFLKSWIAADSAGQWGIVPVPEDPMQNYGGSFLAIPEQSEKKLAAWAFIEYMCATSESQNEMLKDVDLFPAYKPAYSADLYQEGDPYFGGQKTRAVWAEIASSQGEFVTTALDAAAESALSSEVDKFLNQEDISIDQAIKNIEAAIESQVGDDWQLLKDMQKK